MPAQAKHLSLFMSVTQTESQAGASNTPAILTKQEAAQYLKVTPRYLEQMARSGKLNVFRPTRKLWRVSLSSLDAFLRGASIAS